MKCKKIEKPTHLDTEDEDYDYSSIFKWSFKNTRKIDQIEEDDRYNPFIDDFDKILKFDDDISGKET